MDGMSERATPKTPMELNGSTLELNGFITLLKKNSKGEIVSTSHLNKAAIAEVTVTGDDTFMIEKTNGVKVFVFSDGVNIVVKEESGGGGGGGGGSSTLAGLSDVNINSGSLNNGNVLTYNAAEGVWINEESQGGEGGLATRLKLQDQDIPEDEYELKMASGRLRVEPTE